jgi:DNA polymerase/3'-5' exonuclease PolX
MEQLQEFYSVGPKLSENIWTLLKEHKLVEDDIKYTKAQLRSILTNNVIFEQLPVATQQSVIYNPLNKIPRLVIQTIEEEFKKYAGDIKFDIAGSYRRKRDTSTDIDLVLMSITDEHQGQNVWDRFVKQVQTGKKIVIMEPYAKGNDRISTLIKIVPKTANENKKEIYVKMDVFIAEPEEYLFALLYATGSGKFNIRMRSTAKRKGYLLNQRGLYKRQDGDLLQKIDVKDEKEIFDILGIKYKIPEKRVM